MAQNFDRQKGFTLLEMIFAITIISVGVLGVYNGMSFAIANTQKAREFFMGAYLAQEGIEIVKNIRDTNWVASVPWDSGLLDIDCTSGCQADYLTNLSAYAGSYLQIDSNGFYNYGSGLYSIYKRKITIDNPSDPDTATSTINIIVDVYFNGVTTTVKEDIRNWYLQ
ncbi:MAG: prepilin-type N-terminal cleavage/methylation domain-containing protein [Candidatus Paceibacterota bacterium]|jgi:prepilin-type N-terminal cleavage/methylation domain-containing protein